MKHYILIVLLFLMSAFSAEKDFTGKYSSKTTIIELNQTDNLLEGKLILDRIVYFLSGKMDDKVAVLLVVDSEKEKMGDLNLVLNETGISILHYSMNSDLELKEKNLLRTP